MTTPRGIVPALLVAAATGYYGLYFQAGFNIADDGNYAQLAYELYLGRPPEDLLFGYGVLWFLAGDALFHVFGVDFLAVRLLFFATMTLTAVLVYGAVLKATEDQLPSLVAALAVLVVPPFPATAFYGPCVLLNAFGQMWLVRAGPRDTKSAAGFSGAALALTFLIRPDLAFVFAGSMLICLIGSEHHGWWRRAAGGFGAVAVAAAGIGALTGTGAIMIQQILAYPEMMVTYALAGLTGSGVEPGTAVSVLARPPLEYMVTADWPKAGLAWLIYGSVFIGAMGLAVLIRDTATAWRTSAYSTALISMIACVTGLAAVPHAVLFRPDLPHVANSFPGLAVLIAYLVWRFGRSPVVLQRVAAAPPLAFAAVYLTYGLTQPGTGSIFETRDRSETFAALNGVEAMVAPWEHRQLTWLRDVVVENSDPGDAIVCVPYCPGVAFMTDRRMLFPTFYVDDGTPARQPQWIADAIARTETDRPPVIIVMDWALHGTEQSRFPVWAAEYMEAARGLAKETRQYPGIQVFLL